MDPLDSGTERALLTGPLEPKLAQLAGRRSAETLQRAGYWIGQLEAEDPASATAVLDRLDRLLDHVAGDGLGRWIVGGLRRYNHEPARQRAFFRLEDPRAVEALLGESAAVDLQQVKATLTWLFCGLIERDMVVQPLHRSALNAPEQRPVLTAGHLLLPDDYTVLDGSDRYRLYCAAIAHAVAHLRHSPFDQDTVGLKPMAIAVVSGIEDARVEQLLCEELPGVRSWFGGCMAPQPGEDALGFADFISRMDHVLFDSACSDGNHWVGKARELFERARREHGLRDYAAFRRIASVLANDLGQMRVRYDPQRYAVPQPYRDDNSYLWNYGPPRTPPSDPMTLDAVGVRTEQREADDSAGERPLMAPEQELGRFLHPEWDGRIELLRADWCTVIEKRPAWSLLPISAGPEAPKVPRARSRRLSRARRLRRQWEGEDIDLNAAIEVLVDRRLGLSPDARLFMRPGHDRPLASLLVLLDLSESANDRIGGSMRSILDLEKDAALMLAASVDPVYDRLAIHGFSSDGRNEVNYLRLLDFGMPARHPLILGTVRSVQAALSTRMGAALRRATTHLAAEPGSQKAVIVITDGVPSDVDVFDACYLIEDARVAVQEAARQGVRALCVAIEAHAPSRDGAPHPVEDSTRRIFGWRNYRIVDNPLALPSHLSSLYQRWTAG